MLPLENPGNPELPPQSPQPSLDSGLVPLRLSSPNNSGISSTNEERFPQYLRVLIPTQQNAGELRNRIVAILTSLRAGYYIDLEALAQDIFIESWVKRTPITFVFVRHRFLNAVSANRSHKKAIESSASVPLASPVDAAEVKERLDQVMRIAALTANELSVIFALFYQGLTQENAATELRRSHSWLRETLTSAMEKLCRAGRIIQGEDDRKDKQ